MAHGLSCSAAGGIFLDQGVGTGVPCTAGEFSASGPPGKPCSFISSHTEGSGQYRDQQSPPGKNTISQGGRLAGGEMLGLRGDRLSLGRGWGRRGWEEMDRRKGNLGAACQVGTHTLALGCVLNPGSPIVPPTRLFPLGFAAIWRSHPALFADGVCIVDGLLQESFFLPALKCPGLCAFWGSLCPSCHGCPERAGGTGLRMCGHVWPGRHAGSRGRWWGLGAALSASCAHIQATLPYQGHRWAWSFGQKKAWT